MVNVLSGLARPAPAAMSILPWISVSLFLGGLAYRLPSIARLDEILFLYLHRMLSRPPWRGLFRTLWPLGTTPVTLMVLLALTLYKWHAGLYAALGYTLGASLERLIKVKLRRARPFAHLLDVEMLQPRHPHDPSYPSGDALRAWFLVGILAYFLGTIWGMLSGGLALLVSLGRIALGVHHPLDVLSGSGLGLFSAWFALALWSG